MIEDIVSIGLPVDENYRIQKMRIIPNKEMHNPKRICIVTGTHGDELEGQYVCYLLNALLQEHVDQLDGIVDIYPALNPMGIMSITRGIPGFDLDMNRIFPGTLDSSMVESAAAGIIADMEGADMCIDIHASNIFLREIPQVRISEMTAKELVPYAKKLNIDFIWVHQAATVLESTLAHTLNSRGVKTLVVEMGVGMRITKEYANQLLDGILCVMKEIGIWKGNTITPKEPILSLDKNVAFINASSAGLFVPEVLHGARVEKGDLIGELTDPLTGKVLEKITSPCCGMVFTLREYPIVDEGSLIARILERK